MAESIVVSRDDIMETLEVAGGQDLSDLVASMSRDLLPKDVSRDFCHGLLSAIGFLGALEDIMPDLGGHGDLVRGVIKRAAKIWWQRQEYADRHGEMALMRAEGHGEMPPGGMNQGCKTGVVVVDKGSTHAYYVRIPLTEGSRTERVLGGQTEDVESDKDLSPITELLSHVPGVAWCIVQGMMCLVEKSPSFEWAEVDDKIKEILNFTEGLG